jgi:hypothetical protein
MGFLTMRDHRKLCCAHTMRGTDAIWVHTCIHNIGHPDDVPHHCTCTYEWDVMPALDVPA